MTELFDSPIWRDFFINSADNIPWYAEFLRSLLRFVIALAGGLGNQLFQIASIIGVAKVNNQEFYSRFPDFNYRYPAVGSVIRNHLIAILSLLLWTLILIFSFRLIIKRNYF